ncbi:MAG: adenylate/guanylate cyclase domain-containing protein, partial [Nitrososphaerales archaeon]
TLVSTFFMEEYYAQYFEKSPSYSPKRFYLVEVTSQQGDRLPEGERRLAAIMFTDMVGYTSLSQNNEALAMQLLEEHRKLLRPFFPKQNGKEVKTIGDSFLVEFASALEAVRCAFDIQQSINERNFARPTEKKILLRIGIHLGDVIHSEEDVYGDAVNVASRIEPLAAPGGVCITQQVFDHVRKKLEFPIASLGKQQLQNVDAPIEVYKVVLPWEGGVRSSFDRHRIAILPLANISPYERDEYFADGMTEELISTLSKIRELKVISRTSVMRYKTTSKNIDEIAKELGVGSILEGSVRRASDDLRINVQLIDPTNDEHLWSQDYDRKFENVFAIQKEIALQVAEALRVHLLSSEKKDIERRATGSTEAYTLYLKGRYHWYTRSEAGLIKAIKYFEEAVSRDPEYALAFVGLADCYSILGVFGFRRPSLVYPKAKEYSLRAVELDEELAEAHASMAEVLMHYYHDWDGSERELELAVKLNSNYAQAHVWKSSWYAAHGIMDKAIAEARLAEELDPFSVVVMNELSKNFYYARRYDDAIAQFRHSLEIQPDSAYLHKGLAETYAQKSMFKESIVEIEKAMSFSGGSVFILCAAGYIYAVS